MVRVLIGVSAFTMAFGLSAAELRPVTATFRVERRPSEAAALSAYEWKLHRSESCVAADDERSQVSEQWRRDEQGRIWYTRIFHKEKKVIEYQPADLRIGGVESKWSRIASVVEPAELRSMELQQQVVDSQGRAVSVYRGMRQGKPWEIQWLEADQMPVRISVEDQASGGHYSLQLLTLRGESRDSSACGIELSAYEFIDFSDIGDRQGDPFIAGLMKYEGFSHGHGH